MQCSVGILAGGQARRFGGQDKAWLEIDGRPLIEHLAECLRPQAAEILVSANRRQEDYARLGLRAYADREGAGPLAGIARLLAEAGQEWLLVVPCDTTPLPTDWARRFMVRAAASGADVVYLHDGARAHPTFSLMRTQLADSARRALDAGNYGLMRWLDGASGVLLEGAAPANFNTPADLEALRRRWSPVPVL